MKRFLVISLVAAVAFAADLTGKWTGTFQDMSEGANGGSDTAYMDLKVSGQAVTGTVGPNESSQMEIRNGKLEGTKLTFEVARGDLVMKFDLVFDGETIKGTVSGESGGEQHKAKLDLKRKE